jgi:hypothetical protein
MKAWRILLQNLDVLCRFESFPGSALVWRTGYFVIPRLSLLCIMSWNRSRLLIPLLIIRNRVVSHLTMQQPIKTETISPCIVIKRECHWACCARTTVPWSDATVLRLTVLFLDDAGQLYMQVIPKQWYIAGWRHGTSGVGGRKNVLYVLRDERLV